ncbi:MAG: 50S ribosomal protein L6 [Clostridia bacterium]|nr:50S ribosomal protein L6 [Clostridia bacterium]
MSRIGRMPITVPAGVEVKVDEGNLVTVKGKLGTLQQQISPKITVKVDGATVTVERSSDEKEDRSLHGLSRTLINNMVVGVSEGYKKVLEIYGTGYRATVKDGKLLLFLGHSLVGGAPQEALTVAQPEGITFEVAEKAVPITITVKGYNKQQVGQIAAVIRGKRPPEPYHGKGIRYAGENVRRKVGKSGKSK